ncbi:MAG TPA: glycine zipper family protein [Acetobacteraceae bacterium]|nr:glycine zipper family protein [Acetobacteraceae bacterium]
MRLPSCSQSALALLLPLALGACAVAPPTGPTIAVMPGQGKTLAAFQGDDAACRGYASARTGGVSPAQAGATSGVASAALGTGVGAAAGAAIGAASGAAGPGAAIGAASGLLFGSLLGLQNSAVSAGGVQSAYNIAYAQCMAARGNQVPPPATYPGYSAYPGYYGYWPYYPGYYSVYP